MPILMTMLIVRCRCQDFQMVIKVYFTVSPKLIKYAAYSVLMYLMNAFRIR